ncbi:MAG: hypothetical protein LBG28_01050 [Tannerella sp.]|jgi:hypothetical protein|nr:hypothetical protein [Tannerella sp.]
MDKEILQQIANVLYINVQQVKPYGLLQGKLGIAIFFYHYARYTEDERYETFSDEYIRFIFDKLGSNAPEKFAEGLSGIGWGFDYLIKEGFLNADDNVLEEVDMAVGQMNISDFQKEIELTLPLFSKGLYFIQRDNRDIIGETVFQLDKFMQTHLFSHVPFMYLNSIIYFILTSIKKNIEAHLCKTLLDRLFAVVKQNITADMHLTDMDYLLLEKNISLIDDALPEWRHVLSDRTDINLHKNIRDISFVDFLFPQGRQYDLGNVDLWRLLPEIIRQSKRDGLSIYNGLAGIGIFIINNNMRK